MWHLDCFAIDCLFVKSSHECEDNIRISYIGVTIPTNVSGSRRTAPASGSSGAQIVSIITVRWGGAVHADWMQNVDLVIRIAGSNPK
jgi:hypothetical protein